jgi:hypothetical protein
VKEGPQPIGMKRCMKKWLPANVGVAIMPSSSTYVPPVASIIFILLKIEILLPFSSAICRPSVYTCPKPERFSYGLHKADACCECTMFWTFPSALLRTHLLQRIAVIDGLLVPRSIDLPARQWEKLSLSSWG